MVAREPYKVDDRPKHGMLGWVSVRVRAEARAIGFGGTFSPSSYVM